ncbi:MAG: hypothetical protein NZP74_10635 [Anaerolineales bacterium]|nr:hypothetical protein [Anaerolineales bacterium]MDW8276734.1 hypothetical protein [Anaerolineales bacterium]
MSGKVSPVADKDAERPVQDGFGSTLLMAFGWTLLTMALLGGAYLAYRYLWEDARAGFAIQAPLLIVGLTYLAGWVVSLLSIRRHDNLVLPVVVRVYTYGVLAGIVLVYFRAVYKIFAFPENASIDALPGRSIFILVTGCIVLVTLSLLVEKFYLKPHATILLIAAAIHLMIAMYHYVFIGTQKTALVNFDILYLLLMLFMALVVARRHRVLRQMIASLVKSKHHYAQN